MPSPLPLTLTSEEREQLLALTRGRNIPQKLGRRARIVLLASEGLTNGAIAQRVGCNIHTVRQWRTRMAEYRLRGLEDRPKPGRPSPSSPDREGTILATTLTSPPDATHWSAARLAAVVGTSASTVLRTWRLHGLKPHRVTTFKYSTDPLLTEKVIDLVGLYLHPPEGAIVLSVDEKSQIQALERTQPLLPLGFHKVAAHTHDYMRHGTTTLFAALEVATGTVTTAHHARHRHQEYLHFLRRLDVAYPATAYPGRELHLIADNYRTHKHVKVQRWLKRRPRFVVHFTPTGASWMNMVELWFSILTRQRLRRDSFRSVTHLRTVINEFTQAWNGRAKPFTWTKTSEQILQKARQRVV